MNVFGTFAYCGSGQDTLAEAIERVYGFRLYSLGDEVRRIATEMGLSHTREDLQAVRKQREKESGRDFLAIMLSAQIRLRGVNAIITGIRTLAELAIFRDAFNMPLIHVYAAREVRLARLLRRGTERDPATEQAFIDQEGRERRLFDLPALENESDHRVEFNMTLAEFDLNKESFLAKLPFLKGYRPVSTYRLAGGTSCTYQFRET